MARQKDPAHMRAIRGDPVMTLARTRVPLDRPLPPCIRNKEIAESSRDHSWKDLIGVIKAARGCNYAACSRVVEDPETVLFVLEWWDQECLDEFKASPDYAVFLISLGMLDLAKPATSGVPSSTFSPSGTIQTVKFLSRGASSVLGMDGWLSFHTVTLPHPVTDVQRERYRSLSGPNYRRRWAGSTSTISDQEFYLMMVKLPMVATGRIYLQHGWVQELRQVQDEQGGEAGITVQDAFFYFKWLSREVEEEWRNALPEVEFSWDDELRDIGALAAKEEHVDLVLIALGRRHNA